MRFRTSLALAFLGAGLFLPCAARAQFQIDWYTIDGGGGSSSGGTFSLTGTIGQVDASTVTGGALEARCGFWGVGPTPCSTDCDANALIEPVDIACFVNLWFSSLQSGTLAGDFDQNGVVAPADIGSFVSTWFAALGSGC